MTTRAVTADAAWRTPQFWLLWAVLCLNVSAGIGVLGMASPMIQEIFHGRVSASAAAGFAGLLSLFNIAGRIFWASLSDRIGRKATYAVFFALGMLLYASVPFAGQRGSLVLFVAIFCVILTMYGGGFADHSSLPGGPLRRGVRRRDSRQTADRVVDRRHPRTGARELHPRIPAGAGCPPR